MEYVPKHTTEKHFLMVKSWLFVMVFVVEPIKTLWCFFYFIFYSGIVAAVSHDKHERSPPH